MDKIEKIRRKVKELQDEFISIQPKDCSLELIKSYAGYAYLDKVLSFLNSSSEEPDKNLEEAANEFANQDCVTFISRKKGFIAGAEWQKEQMLKDAVEASVNTYELAPGGSAYVEFVADMPVARFRSNDRVRIIALKVEEK